LLTYQEFFDAFSARAAQRQGREDSFQRAY